MLEQRTRERVEPRAILSQEGDYFVLRRGDDSAHLVIEELLGLRRHLRGAGEEGSRPIARDHGDWPSASLIPQRPTIWRASEELIDVGLGARADLAEDELLGDAAAEGDLDLREYPRLEVVEAVGVGAENVTPSAIPRGMIETLRTGSAPGVSIPTTACPLVVGRPATILLAHHHLPFGAEHDPLERVGEVGFFDHFVLAPSRRERGLVHQVGEVGSDHPRCRRRDAPEVDVGSRGRRATRRIASRPSGQVAGLRPGGRTAPVEEVLVEHVRPIRRPG